MLSFVSSGAERFLKVLRHFLTFLGCVEIFKRYLKRSHGFPAVLKGSRRFEAYCDAVWGHSEVFSWVLSDFERLLKVLSSSATFCIFLSSSNNF